MADLDKAILQLARATERSRACYESFEAARAVWVEAADAEKAARAGVTKALQARVDAVVAAANPAQEG